MFSISGPFLAGAKTQADTERDLETALRLASLLQEARAVTAPPELI